MNLMAEQVTTLTKTVGITFQSGRVVPFYLFI